MNDRVPKSDEAERTARLQAYSTWGREQDAARAARGSWTVEQMTMMDELVRNSRLLVEQMKLLVEAINGSTYTHGKRDGRREDVSE